MMSNYIAFKSLCVTNGELYSPWYHIRWNEAYVPFLGRFTYALETPSLEERQGIHAATLYEAWRYVEEHCRLFLVIPSPDSETEIGTSGWRTTCAILIGELTSLREAAKLILSSHQAGYPQVDEIIRWARFVLKPRRMTTRELVEQSAEVKRMIRVAAWGYYVKNTPIKVIEGDQPPTLVGAKHVVYQRHSHRLIRYSDLRIEVGESWSMLTELTSP